MTVALAPAAVLEDPRSQGADPDTHADTAQTPQALPATKTAEAQGAGAQPEVEPGGSHSDAVAQPAPTSRAGGGGGWKDDPWARASLTPQLQTNAVFDLAARNDALFLARVAPCLKDGAASLAGVMIQVALGPDGLVTRAEPVRAPGLPGMTTPAPTPPEAQAIAAVRACGPYHDIVLGSTPVLKFPKAEPALTPKTVTTLASAARG